MEIVLVGMDSNGDTKSETLFKSNDQLQREQRAYEEKHKDTIEQMEEKAAEIDYNNQRAADYAYTALNNAAEANNKLEAEIEELKKTLPAWTDNGEGDMRHEQARVSAVCANNARSQIEQQLKKLINPEQ